MRHNLGSGVAAAALVVIVGLLGVGASGCGMAGADVRGSGKTVEARRDVGGFTAITLSGAIDLDIEVGKATSVVVIGDDNVVPLIRTRLRGGRLVIDSRGSYQTRTPLVVRVTTPALAELTSNGSGTSAVRSASGDALRLTLNGSGAIEVSGAVERLHAELAGSGAIDAAGVRATSVRAELSGSGAMELTATRALDAQVSGSGSITYGGAPTQVQRQVTGSGHIEPR